MAAICNIGKLEALQIITPLEGAIMAAVFEVTLGAEDGSSRLIRTEAASAADARNAVQNHLRPGEAVVFVETAELDELDDDGLRDHPQEGSDLDLAPAPKTTDFL